MGWTWPWQKWTPMVTGIISGPGLRSKLRAKHPGAQIIITDREYQIPADPADVTWRCSPSDLFYTAESRDCDDFVRMARGWLSRKNLGNLLAMDCAVSLPGGSAHAVLAFLAGDDLVFGEPQTGKMWTPPLGYKIFRLIA